VFSQLKIEYRHFNYIFNLTITVKVAQRETYWYVNVISEVINHEKQNGETQRSSMLRSTAVLTGTE
jgi:hypothetical protein